MAVEPRNINRDSPVSHTTCWEDFLNELCQPDPLADLTIDVDGHQLHTSKFLLAKVSSKFRQMFTDPGVEQPGILSLPGTGLHAATEFLRWLLPSEISVLSDETVKPLLQIALDYDIKTLKKHCDQHLVDKLKACEGDEDRVECLMMADQFKLTGALEEAVSQLSRLSMDELKALDSALDIGPVMMCQILQRRMESMETCGNATDNATLPESVTLVVDDREIEAPAAALMTASDVFKAMITSDFLERKTRRVAMPGKSYDAVQFMVQYVTSTDHVPIPGDQLVQCIELAEEYLLGRMKHACTQYILTEADNAELNDCLLYLRLAHQFQLTDVENKVLELTYQRSTADILACTNYDIASAAPLIIKHAQWLEERVELYTDRIARIKSSVHSVSYDVTKNVSWLVEKVRHATKYTRYNSSVCGNGHSLGKTRGERFFKPYDEKCKNCSYLALGGVQLKLNEICAEGSNTPHFLHGIENKLGDIKKYCDA